MGMYADVDGKEIKYSGLIAEACRLCGIYDPDSGESMVVIRKDQGIDVLAYMVEAIESGRSLSEGNRILGQSIYRLASDAKVLAALFDWVRSSSKDDIVFG